MALADTVDRLLREALAKQPKLGNAELAVLLRLLAKWRAALLANTLAQRQGGEVLAGPFAGMRYSPAGTEGSAAAQLLGCYEHELHDTVERLIARSFGAVLNIGCASGYYAVGLARRLPAATVHAFDIDERAQANCRRTAAMNGVEARVLVGGRFAAADFARFSADDPLVVADIEGAEMGLLDPAAAPALAGMTILVECHDCFSAGISTALAERFAATHRVTRIDHTMQAPKLPDWLMTGNHLDQLVAIWEWRVGPTPWLLLEAK